MTSKPTENIAKRQDDDTENKTLADIAAQPVTNDAYARERELLGLDALEAMYGEELCH